MSKKENKALADAEKAAKKKAADAEKAEKEAAEAEKAAAALEKLEAEKAAKEADAAEKAEKAEKKRLAAQAKIDDKVVPYDLKGRVIHINGKPVQNKGKAPRKVVRQYYCMAKI